MKNKLRNLILLVFCGMIVSFSLCCNIIVADKELALDQYGAQLLKNDSTAGLSQTPIIAVNIIKLKQMLPSNIELLTIIALSFSLVMYLLIKKSIIKKSVTIAIISILFGIIQVTGLSMSNLGNWDFLFANIFQIIISSCCIVGQSIIGYVGICIVHYFLDYLNMQIAVNKPGEHKLLGRHPFVYPLIIIIVCWLPYLICSYPGSLSWDSESQVLQGIGMLEYNTHHPVLSSFLQGGAVKLGVCLGSPEFGLFLYVLLQTLICAVAFSLIIYLSIKFNVPRFLTYFLIVFYALVPVWGAFMQAVIKDTLFVGFYTLFITLGILLFNKRLTIISKHATVVLFLIIAVITCLLRNNGIFAIIPGVIIFLYGSYGKSQIKKVIVLTLIVCTVLLSYNKIIKGTIATSTDTAVESLSICLQQTGFYVKYYGDEVTEDEKNIINNVVDYERLADAYTPYISDPIKALWKYSSDSEDLKAYLGVWLKMFFKHPTAYIQATHANTYGYYTITANDLWDVQEQYYFYMHWDKDEFELNYLFPTEVRVVLYDLCLIFDNIPLIGLLTNLGFYTWLLIAVMLWMLKRNVRSTWILVPEFIYILTCIAGPVTLLRYYLPVIATFPIIIIATFLNIKRINSF
jgi:hypothetical protein